jgi:hypothetical protein
MNRPINLISAYTTNIIAALPAVGKIENLANETITKFEKIPIGTKLEGKVIAQFNDGTYAVKIADSIFRMSLPISTENLTSINLILSKKIQRCYLN